MSTEMRLRTQGCKTRASFVMLVALFDSAFAAPALKTRAPAALAALPFNTEYPHLEIPHLEVLQAMQLPNLNLPARLDATNTTGMTAWQKVGHLAHLVKDAPNPIGTMTELQTAEAKVAAERIIAGDMTNVEGAETVMRAASQVYSAAELALKGLEITDEEIAAIAGIDATDEDDANDVDKENVKDDKKLGLTERAQLKKHQKLVSAQEQPGREGFGAFPKWPAGSLKYCFASTVNEGSRTAVEEAIADFRSRIDCIFFTDVGLQSDGDGSAASQGGTARCSGTDPAVYVTTSAVGCHANAGFLNLPSQVLNLGTGCLTSGIIQHEFAHALGFAHEQQRPDRDSFVTVHTNNAEADKASEFAITGTASTAQPYDILSIMHYGRRAFATGTANTIDVKPAGYAMYTTDPARFAGFNIGQRGAMTDMDADQFAQYYGCSAMTPEPVTIPCQDNSDLFVGMYGCDILQHYCNHPSVWSDYSRNWCPQSCNTCCEDKQYTGYTSIYSSCSSAAANGGCTSYPHIIVPVCPQSCAARATIQMQGCSAMSRAK